MQHGKGAEAGASFNNASQTFFGSKGTKSFLVKLTTTLTILFFINCFIIGIFSSQIQQKHVINILDTDEKLVIQKEKNIKHGLEDIPIEIIERQ